MRVIALGILSFCSAIFFSNELPASDAIHNELSPAVSDQHKSWKQYGGGPDQSKYLDFKEITKSNVNQLEVAWVYPSGGNGMFNPIVVNGVMYVLSEDDSLVALEATTGKKIWVHSDLSGIVRTGINYWESKDGKDRRLIICVQDTLQALDAITGLSITNFGDNGSTSLKEGLGRDPATIGREQSTSPGQIYDNLIFLGSSPGENYFSAPGHVRAYDVVTGKLVWVFHTVPWPGEFGYETWPKDAYKYIGGVNTWGEITVDEKNGIVFFPLGAPTYDYYGADRIGSGLFGDCLLALDARTGKRLWHFQAVHHDLWDYDFCSAPQLITANHDGKKIEAVAIAGKQGFLYVFNRLTGEALWPIEERPVPPSDMPQEEAWPTQPFPTAPPPFTRHVITTNDLNPFFSPEKREQWVKRLAAARTAIFQPLSDKFETIAMPGAVGGANRGNTAADPDKGIVYVTSQDFASVYKLKPEFPIPSASLKTVTNQPPPFLFTGDQMTRGRAAYGFFCQSCHGTNLAGVGAIPALADAGKRIRFGDFKTQIMVGKGQMPGFPFIDEEIVADLYALVGGTNTDSDEHISDREGSSARAGSGERPNQRRPRWQRNRPLSYPPGVYGPTNNYSSGYGMEYPDLLSPPWSSITAYDLNTGTIKWRSPLGHDARVPKVNGQNAGVPNGSQRKGMVVTSNGLIFATCLDGKVYAYDSDNGDLLWSSQLPRNTEAMPAMYEINGHQYLVICDMGKVIDPALVDKMPAGYIVYALPKSDAHLSKR
jgi:quinoprotein glucose dehydrogenase